MASSLFESEQLRNARRQGDFVHLGAAGSVYTEQRFARVLDVAVAGQHVDAIRGGVSELVGSFDGPDMLRRLSDQRASLRVRRIHVIDDRVRELAFEAHRALDEEININAYWSAPDTQLGLAPHDDGYDIVVWQVAGAKTWTLHTESPHTFTLQCGEAFFLPKGLRHQANNPHDTASLHLTFGIYARTTRSLVEWVATEMSPNAVELEKQDMAPAISTLRTRVNALLAAPDAAEKFNAYRSGVEYERMLMTPEQHARSDARRYR